MPFADRSDAGRQLAAQLAHFAGDDVVVLGLPRGGVPVAAEVAHALDAPLDVIIVRKLGVPSQPELAMGAVGEDGVRVLNEDVRRMCHVSPEAFARVEARERAAVDARAAHIRTVRPREDLHGKSAVIVDDGIATGASVRAACAVARQFGAQRIVIATPVGPPSTMRELLHVADEVVAVEQPEPFAAIGFFYRDFSATSEQEVVRFLLQSPRKKPR
jgi:putative phosphoribosyl transferase